MQCAPMNPFLKSSWERSKIYGVNPNKTEEAILGVVELAQYRKQNEEFLHKINPTLERLYGWIKTSRSMVLVSDASGYILESMGDPAFVDNANKVHLSQGACWAEQLKGTNAIGTVIAEKKPMAVLGQDHYCKDHAFLFCVGAPIFDPFGKLIAVLDISGYYKEYHSSMLAMVDVMARNIEDWLLIHRPEQQLVISLSPEQDKNYRALLAVNKDGIIIGANREALTLLKIDSLQNTGKQLSDLITGSEQLLQKSYCQCNQDLLPVYEKKQKNNKWMASILADTRPSHVSFHEVSTKKPVQRDSKSTVKYTFSNIYGNDPEFRAALQLAKRAAVTDYNILITGESGTGKEMVSQAIHDVSHRSDKPFVALNCGAIAKSLMESELFGYEAGAFTGAKKTGHPGKIELANGGTLFLDEIAEMPSDMQVSLLRVLQEFTVTRIGGVKPIYVDVRIIAATHKDLWQEVQAGRFRADLFYRLQGLTILLPPLRERKDCLELGYYLLESISQELGVKKLTFSANAKKMIQEYSWPGNVRELIAALRHAAFMSGDEMIDICHFPQNMIKGYTRDKGIASHSLEQVENNTILTTLKKTEGNIAQAARMLGISRNTLYRKIKNLTEKETRSITHV